MAPVAGFLKALFGFSTVNQLSGHSDDLFEALHAMEREEGSSGLEVEQDSPPVERAGRGDGVTTSTRTASMNAHQNQVDPTVEVELAESDANGSEADQARREWLAAREERLRPAAPRPGGMGPRPRRWIVPDR